VPELLEYLESSPDVVASVVSENEVEVSLMGSFALDAMRMELFLRIRAWEAGKKARLGSVDLVDP
jgi:hypothetical protein